MGALQAVAAIIDQLQRLQRGLPLLHGQTVAKPAADRLACRLGDRAGPLAMQCAVSDPREGKPQTHLQKSAAQRSGARINGGDQPETHTEVELSEVGREVAAIRHTRELLVNEPRPTA